MLPTMLAEGTRQTWNGRLGVAKGEWPGQMTAKGAGGGWSRSMARPSDMAADVADSASQNLREGLSVVSRETRI